MMQGWGKFEKKDGIITCSPSRLILFREDPELYEEKYIFKEDDTTDSMEFGTLVHMAILEPEKFESTYAVTPEKTKENNLTKAELEEKLKSMGLKTYGNKPDLIARIRTEDPSFPKQYDELLEELESSQRKHLPYATVRDIKRIVKKVLNHPTIGSKLHGALKERDGYFTHDSGTVIRFKADAIKKYDDFGLVIDIKVTKDWDQRWFDRSNFEEGRHIQGHIYCEGTSKIENFPYNRMLFIAIEPKKPFRIRGYEMDFGALEAGKAETDYYLKEFNERVKNNDWSPRKDDLLIKQTTFSEFQWDKVKEVSFE